MCRGRGRHAQTTAGASAGREGKGAPLRCDCTRAAGPLGCNGAGCAVPIVRARGVGLWPAGRARVQHLGPAEVMQEHAQQAQARRAASVWQLPARAGAPRRAGLRCMMVDCWLPVARWARGGTLQSHRCARLRSGMGWEGGALGYCHAGARRHARAALSVLCGSQGAGGQIINRRVSGGRDSFGNER